MTISRLHPLTLEMRVKLVSEANQRGHWSRGYQRAKQQKEAVLCAWLVLGKPTFKPPARVVITRIGVRTLDTDNLARSAKAVRDEVAERILQTDDGSPLILWEYEQKKPLPITKYKYECIVEVMPWSGVKP